MIRRSLTITILLCCFVLCILNQQLPSMTNGFPKILWSYWEEGFDNNPSIKVYHELHRAMASGWQVHMLNRTTVMPFLQRIPYYQDDIDKINFYLLQHKSDYIRYLLISYYGGVWMDISSFFVEELDWLDFDRLRQNEDVINKHGAEPDVLLFTTSLYGSKQVYYSKQQKVQYEISPGYELWFIAAKPKTKFFEQFITIYRKGIILKMHMVLGPNNYITTKNYQIRNNLARLRNSAYLSSLQVIQFMIKQKQKQLNQKNQSNNKKQLAAFYYKLWHIKSQDGPFAALRFSGFVQQVDSLARYNRSVLEKFNVSLRYFVKMVGDDRIAFKKYFFNPKRNLTFQAAIETIADTQQQLVEKYFCPQQFVVHEESVFYQYVLKRSPYQFDTKLTNKSYRPILQCSELRNFVSEAKAVDFRLFYQELLRILIAPAVLLLIVLVVLCLIKACYQKRIRIRNSKQVPEKEFIQINIFLQ